MANSKEQILEQYRNEAYIYREIVGLVNFDIVDLFPLFINTLNKLYPDHNARINILDIGAGNGVLTEVVAASYPNANITMLDFSDAMLGSAKAYFQSDPRFSKLQINYANTDFISEDLPKGPFDLVMSSYAIHHTRTEEELTALFIKINSVLTPGTGTFLTVDMFLGETKEERENQVEKAISKWEENFSSKDKALEWAKLIKEEDTPSTLPRIIHSLHKSSKTILPLLMPNSDSMATIYGMTKLSLAKIRDLGLYDYVNSWTSYISHKGNHVYETASLPFDIEKKL